MSAPHREFLLVRMGDHQVGLPLAGLVAVIDLPTVHPVPAAAAALRGVTELRGRLVPVLRLADLLGLAAPEAAGAMGVVLEGGGRLACLEVDDAVAIVRGDPLPVPPGESLPWAGGVMRRAEGVVPVLDPAALRERFTTVEVPSGVR